jgi:hypothetical protein
MRTRHSCCLRVFRSFVFDGCLSVSLLPPLSPRCSSKHRRSSLFFPPLMQLYTINPPKPFLHLTLDVFRILSSSIDGGMGWWLMKIGGRTDDEDETRKPQGKPHIHGTVKTKKEEEKEDGCARIHQHNQSIGW